MNKAYSYLRFSTPDQMRGDSFRRQTELAQSYAQKHGLELDTQLSLSDLGVSAFRGRNARTGALGAFLHAIDNGMVAEGSLLLVESLDRVTRQDPWDALPLFQQIINAGVVIVTLQDGKTYSRDEMRANPLRILESLFVMIRANEESATKSRRLKAVWQSKRQKGGQQPLTARAPYWLRLDRSTGKFAVIEERAAVVQRVFALTLQGLGQHRIAETLNGEGVPVFGGGRHWHRTYIVKLLTNSAVIGTFVPHTVEYEGGRKRRRPGDAIKGYFPAVIDRESFEHVQAMARDARSPLRGRHSAAVTMRNLFGGLARCPICDGTMTRVTKGNGNGRPYLVCTSAKAGAGCRYRAVPYAAVEETFLENAGFIIATAPAGDGGAEIDNSISGIEAGIDVTRDAIANLLGDIEAGRSLAERHRIRELEAEVDRMERERDDLYDRRAAVAGPFIAQRLDALDEALGAIATDRVRVNTLLRQLFSAAIIDYKSGHLTLRWKHGGETSVVFGWPEEAQEAVGG